MISTAKNDFRPLRLETNRLKLRTNRSLGGRKEGNFFPFLSKETEELELN